MNFRTGFTWRVASIFSLGFMMLGHSARAQTGLQITSPAAGTVLNPGQTITVSVSASGGPIYIGGNRSTGICKWELRPDLSTLPVLVHGSVDNNAGTISVGAMGTTASGPIFAVTSIDLERSDSPQTIAVDHSQVELPINGQIPIAVFGTYADGSVVNLSQSGRGGGRGVARAVDVEGRVPRESDG